MNLATTTRTLVCAMPALLLAACGGGSDATIGGTLTGLGSGLSVTLQDNYTDDLTLTANGTFTFATAVPVDDSYNASVLTQPVGQTCSIANGSGMVDTTGDAVSTIAVSCVTSSSLGGTLSGLPAGTSVTLTDAGMTLPVAVNGTFAFPGTLPAGSSYNVLIGTQPAGHFCSVTNATGTIVANTMAMVTVNCS